MSNNDYYNKYIKYKIKYLKLSNMKGGFVRSALTIINKNPELKSSLLNAAKSVAKSVKDDPEFKNGLITAAAEVANKNSRFQKAAKLVNDNPEIIKGFQKAAKLVNDNREIVGKKAEKTASHALAAQAASHTSAAQALSHTSAVQAVSHAQAAQAVSRALYDIVPPSKKLPSAQLPPAPHDNQEFVGRKICEEILQIQAPRTNLMKSLNGICKLAKQ
jgi:hypothetical protein